VLLRTSLSAQWSREKSILPAAFNDQSPLDVVTNDEKNEKCHSELAVAEKIANNFRGLGFFFTR